MTTQEETPAQEPLPEDPAVAAEEPVVPEGGLPSQVAEPPPPPIEAPPAPESLAEQVYRESHTVPESTGPSDVVPNRPNIRPPEAVEVPEQEAEEVVLEEPQP